MKMKVMLLVLASCLVPVLHCRSAEALGAAAREFTDIQRFGAIADDGTDDTEAIRRAIAAVRESGGTVFVPAGTFQHGDVLVLDGVKLSGGGPASVLRATDDQRQSLQLTGSGAALRDLRLVSDATTRGTRLEHHRVVLNRATDFTVERVEVIGARGTGIFDYGGRRGVIRQNLVKNTQADGIHNTLGATDITIEDNLVTGSGDDLIAVVSYGTAGEPAGRIAIRRNTLFGNRHGRGVAVVGGTEITIADNLIKDPHMAGIYLGTEASYNTNRVDDVVVSGNTIVRAGSAEVCVPADKAGCGQGAVHVFANNRPVTGVVFERNKVVDSRTYAVHLNGVFAQYTTPYEQDVSFRDNRFVGAGADGFHLADSFRGVARFTGNTLWGTQGYALMYDTPVQGSRLWVADNLFADIGLGDAVRSAVGIDQGTAESVEIVSNEHQESAAHPLKYFVEEYVDAATESYAGNLSPYPSFVNGGV